MKRIILTALSVLFISACAVTAIPQQTTEYAGNSSMMIGKMTLFLNQDRSFDLNWRQIDYSGVWEQMDKDRVKLRFDEITDPRLFLSSGVILDSVHVLKFVNRNKIKMEDNTILKRNK